MIRTMTTATNTLNQLQSQMDIIGNNLANLAHMAINRAKPNSMNCSINNSIMIKRILHRVNHRSVSATDQGSSWTSTNELESRVHCK